MPVDVVTHDDSNLIEIHLSGKLTSEDYAHFVPMVDKHIETHGKIRILMVMHDFHGWKLGAAWEDMKFCVKHFSDIEMLAMVGERKWEQGMAVFCKPFTKAKIRYFDHADENEARDWVGATPVATK